MDSKTNLGRRAFFWDILLGTYSPSQPHLDNINDTICDLNEQRTIQMDIPRTRPQHIRVEQHTILEKVITRFCKEEKIDYKQGINEIFGVVAVFQDCGLSWEKVYEYGRMICIKNNFFKDKEFKSLQVVFQWINLLLKYHDFELFDRLNSQNMTPELYATPWVMTLFSNRMSLECIMLLWEVLFIRNDQLMTYFLVIAMLIHQRDLILKASLDILPQTLSGLQIKDIDSVKQIYIKAVELRINTPLSCCIPERIFDLSSQALDQYSKQLDSQNHLIVTQTDYQKLNCQGQCKRNCIRCSLKKIPPEMRYFIEHSEDLNQLLSIIPEVKQVNFMPSHTSYDSNKINIINATDHMTDYNMSYVLITHQSRIQFIDNNCSQPFKTINQNFQQQQPKQIDDLKENITSKKDPYQRYLIHGIYCKFTISNQSFLLGLGHFQQFKTSIKQRILYINKSFMALASVSQSGTQIKIKSLYYLIFLKKITSKLTKTVSFYFNQPLKANSTSFQQFTPRLNDYQQLKPLPKTEIKFTIEMTTPKDAVDCIETAKQFYKIGTSQ